MKKKPKIEKPPECWIEQQPEKLKKKIYGIWALKNTAERRKIMKRCSKETQKKGR